jgi:hypothetical protein
VEHRGDNFMVFLNDFNRVLNSSVNLFLMIFQKPNFWRGLFYKNVGLNSSLCHWVSVRKIQLARKWLLLAGERWGLK